MRNQLPRVAGALKCLIAVCVWLNHVGVLAAENPVSPKPPKKSKSLDPAAGVFSPDQVFRIEIEIPEAEMDMLSGLRWGGRSGNGQERPAVRATVREGTNVYHDVSIHLKGAAGSFRPIEGKPALTLNFDKHAEGQTFHGLQRFSLNNSVQDPSYLTEKICREMFAAAGVPAPRATHAVVKLNKRNLGLYVLVEAYNKQFLRRAFSSDSGHLYDGGFVREIRDGLDLSSGDHPEDRSDLDRLAEAAVDRDTTNRIARLEKILDLDRFLSLLAVDVITCNWDGYAMNRNNYRIYHDPKSDRLVFMPHGLDQMFGVERYEPSMSIFPRVQGLVAWAVWYAPEGRRRYLSRLNELVNRNFDVDALTNRVQQLATLIRPYVTNTEFAGDGSWMIRGRVRPGGRPGSFIGGASFEQAVDYLKERIVRRGESLREQLGEPGQGLAFSKSGIARLDGWKSGVDSGQPMMMEFGADRPPSLHVSVQEGSSVGTWTTEVKLDPGKYRFEGNLRCQDVTPEPGDRRGGAGLRTSSQRSTKRITGNSDWVESFVEFEVEQPATKVELRCELRAIRGRVWFDRQSLVLRKLE